MSSHFILTECLGEFVGTWLLVFMGTAAVTTAVTTGAQVGLWQTAVVWGIAITMAISVASQVSDAHLNPAVTIALAASRQTRFPLWKIVPYILSQLLGAMCSGICVLAVYGSSIARFEAIHHITRGASNSTLSAMAFGEYFPNPQVVLSGALETEDVTPFGALLVEAVGTLVLVLVVRTLNDENNKTRPPKEHASIHIGITISALVSIFAPLSQAGFNPARDLGPRIIASLAGWKTIALPGPRNGFWVYILGPIIGGVLGSIMYDFAVCPSLEEVRTMKEKFAATSPHAEEPVEMVRSAESMHEASVEVVETTHSGSPSGPRACSPHCSGAGSPHLSRAGSPYLSRAGSPDLSRADSPRLSRAGSPRVARASSLHAVHVASLRTVDTARNDVWGEETPCS